MQLARVKRCRSLNLSHEVIHPPLAELSPDRAEASPTLAETNEDAIALSTAHLVGTYIDTVAGDARLAKERRSLIDRRLAL